VPGPGRRTDPWPRRRARTQLDALIILAKLAAELVVAVLRVVACALLSRKPGSLSRKPGSAGLARLTPSMGAHPPW
jgi:hypothetical protein